MLSLSNFWNCKNCFHRCLYPHSTPHFYIKNKHAFSTIFNLVGCLLKRLKTMREIEVAQLYPTFCNRMDCSLPGFSIHEIFQARILEWMAIAFSRGSLRPGIEPRSPTLWADALPYEPRGKIHLSSSEICLNSCCFYFIKLKVYLQGLIFLHLGKKFLFGASPFYILLLFLFLVFILVKHS